MDTANNMQNIAQDNIKWLVAEVKKLTEENTELREHLKKYTAPSRRRKYYENHKTELLKKAQENEIYKLYKPSKEKKREYNKRYNIKKKNNIDMYNATNIDNSSTN